MNGHGGKRAGAGRPAGALGRVTVDIRAIAKPYGAAAVAELARLAGLTDAPGAVHEQTRVAALRELLDRGYGRATTVLAGDDAGSMLIDFRWSDSTTVAAEFTPPLIEVDAAEADADPVAIWGSSC